MKILMINDYRDNIGGAEQYMNNIAEELQSRGHNVLIFSSNLNKDTYRKLNRKSITKYINSVFNYRYFWKLIKVMNNFKPDIIHVHGIFNELSPSIFLATKDIPVFMTVHNNQIVNAVSILSERSGKECKKRTCGGCNNCVGWKGAAYEFVKREVHKRLLKKVRLFITPSKYMGDLISEAGFGPVEVIPNGIKLFNYSKITNFDKLLYVGRLTKEKGVEYLIRAMPDIIKKIPNVKLDIVGDGDEKGRLIKISKDLGIWENVKFVGKVGRDDLEKYYIDSTIVVVPSIYPDNFPTVCIEAMSVGRPIIGTRMGGIPELIADGKTGLLVSHSNSQELADKIKYLLSSKNLLIKISENYIKRSSQYSLNEHIDKIENIYKEYIK